MEPQTQRRIRIKKAKNKKRRFILFSLLTVFLLLFGTLGYAYWDYKQALKDATAAAGSISDKPIEFNGAENKFGKINVLLLGIDSRGEMHSRTDTIMVAQYDQETKKSKLVSIMRDCYVDIPGHEKDKINMAYSYGGPELLRETLKENFGIDVQYYALIDFNGFSKVVDEVFPDGITIDVEKKMSHGLGLTLQPGVQQLHGKELLGYVRFRYDAISDFGRVQRQQKVLQILADKVMSVNGVLKLPRMVGTIQPYIETNIKNSLLLSVASSFISDDNNQIKTLRIPENNTFTNETYILHGIPSDVLDFTPENLDKNKIALNSFLNS